MRTLLRIVGATVGLLVIALIVAVLVLRSRGYTFNTPIFAPDPLDTQQLRARIQLPPGFTIDYYAKDVPKARFMRFAPNGDLLVSSARTGAVLVVERDQNGDGRADAVRTLAEGLSTPHGLDFRDGWLYVAETDKVRRARFDAQTSRLEGELENVVTGIPGGENHSTRTLRFGPDGGMYVTVGSSCNVCLEKDEKRATMLRYEADGSGYEVFATGLRNSVGFDFMPGTNEIYATDNGRDLLGDDFPPCEINKVVRGAFYGWPIANGDRVPDPNFGEGQGERIAASTPPAHRLGAHTAPLGITFYRGTVFPESYRGDAFVALHGSWNRSTKAGYKIVQLDFTPDGKVTETDFAKGFELNEDVIGRPVDVIEGPDGALYISDDFGNAIYRVAYGG